MSLHCPDGLLVNRVPISKLVLLTVVLWIQSLDPACVVLDLPILQVPELALAQDTASFLGPHGRATSEDLARAYIC